MSDLGAAKLQFPSAQHSTDGLGALAELNDEGMARV